MKIRQPMLVSSRCLRAAARPLALPRSLAVASSCRRASSLSQRPDSKYVQFPGAVKSAFTSTLQFEQPSAHDAMPTYRAVDQNGDVIDSAFKPDLTDDEVVGLYKNMLLISIMDLIMFDSQRQGRISFYMVSAGEEAVCVGSASALTKDDVIFCQYREQGVFAQRGFTPKDFMNQLFANRNDPGRGRNMPVHYGSKELNIVCVNTRMLCLYPFIDVSHSTPSPRPSRRKSRTPRALPTRSRCNACTTHPCRLAWPLSTLARAPRPRATSTRRSTLPRRAAAQ